MALGPFLTLGFGNGTFSGSIPVLIMTNLFPGDAAARAAEGGAWWVVLGNANRGIR